MKTKELIEWLESKDLMENCVESGVYEELIQIIKRLEELDELKKINKILTEDLRANGQVISLLIKDTQDK